MKTYKLFRDRNRKFAAVKVGVSWPALFFGGIWMMYNGLWMHATLSAATGLLWFTFEPAAGISLNTLIVGWSVLNILPFVMGNKWRTASLTEEGYEFFTCVQANAPYEAVSCARASLAAATEREMWEKMRTTRAPVGLDLASVPASEPVRAWVPRRNSRWSIAHGMWKRYGVRWL